VLLLLSNDRPSIAIQADRWEISAEPKRRQLEAAVIEITGPPRRRYNNILRVLASLPATVRPA
jgi:hypothetical protein